MAQYSSTFIEELNSLFSPAPLSDALQLANLYVDLDDVRGDSKALQRLIATVRANPVGSTHQIFYGHRGTGKSTELFRLGQQLETGDQKFLVVRLDALEILDLSDLDFPDIFLAGLLPWSHRARSCSSLSAWLVSLSSDEAGTI